MWSPENWRATGCYQGRRKQNLLWVKLSINRLVYLMLTIHFHTSFVIRFPQKCSKFLFTVNFEWSKINYSIIKKFEHGRKKILNNRKTLFFPFYTFYCSYPIPVPLQTTLYEYSEVKDLEPD